MTFLGEKILVARSRPKIYTGQDPDQDVNKNRPLFLLATM
jgi:hypothetical protein